MEGNFSLNVKGTRSGKEHDIPVLKVAGYSCQWGLWTTRARRPVALRLGLVHENGRLLIFDRLRRDVQAVQVSNE